MSTQEAPIPVIIDTDPGTDDAVAIMLALSHPEKIDLRLITSVGGNVSLDLTTRNAQVVTDFVGRSVPIARGISSAEAIPAVDIHGTDGFGNRWPYVNDWERTEHESHLLDIPAVDAQAEVLRSSDVPVTIVAIGPLSNIALLLDKYPELSNKIARIVFMGGAIGRGNKGPYAEFNIGSDVEAAARVISSGLPLVMLPLEVADAAQLSKAALDRLGKLNKVGEAIHDLMNMPEPDQEGSETESMYDPTTIAYLCEPELFTTERDQVNVETEGAYTRGATVVDDKAENKEGKGSVLVCTKVANVDGKGRLNEEGNPMGNAGFTKWLFDTVSYWNDEMPLD